MELQKHFSLSYAHCTTCHFGINYTKLVPGPAGLTELYSKVSPTADLLPQTYVVALVL